MDIKKTTETSAPPPPKETVAKKRILSGTYITIAIISVALYFLLKLEVFGVFGDYLPLLSKFALALIFATLLLGISKIVEALILKKSKSRASGYNLVKVIHLLTYLFLAFIFISFLFANWYAAAVSLGLISLILGFALQTPITSFIGWINILIRAPYHVGDRIQIDNFRGDVVEINYLDTTIWEVGGDHLTNDVPSGRLIRFPNSLVLEQAVFNYSWRKFPYIWNEIPFHVAYNSDLEHVSNVVKEVAKAELGADMEERIKTYKNLLKQTPVDELNIREYPFVSLRIHANTWVEVLLIYLVSPKKAGTTRTRLIKKILAELQKEPEKVLFPSSNLR